MNSETFRSLTRHGALHKTMNRSVRQYINMWLRLAIPALLPNRIGRTGLVLGGA